MRDRESISLPRRRLVDYLESSRGILPGFCPQCSAPTDHTVFGLECRNLCGWSMKLDVLEQKE